MRIPPWVVAAAVIGLALGLGGCSGSDSDRVVLHKPGVYKGSVDPLIEKERSPEQQKRLLARFKQVQTDR